MDVLLTNVVYDIAIGDLLLYVNMGRIRDIVIKVGVVGALDFPHRV